MLWVGLTGCMGCGKSTVAQLLRENHDCIVISADEVSHEVLKTDSEIHQKIMKRYGLDFKRFEFKAYRAEIAKNVFGKPEELTFLEQLLHPKIRNKVDEIKNKLALDQAVAFYDVPLLFEKNMEPMFDKIVGVFVDPEIQKQRLKARNDWSDEEIRKRLKAQLSNEKKIEGCDFVIYNNGDKKSLVSEVETVYKKLLEIK